MTDPSGILARINAEVEAWERRPDAARWRPAVESGVKCGGARMFLDDAEVPATDVQLNTQWRPQPVTLRTLGFTVEFERQMAALSQNERDEFVAYWQASPWSFEQAWGYWVMRRMTVAMSAAVEPLMSVLSGACDSMTAFSRSLRLEAWPHGWAKPCFCHPAPFPAARDYRRRTKHRNRRRKH